MKYLLIIITFAGCGSPALTGTVEIITDTSVVVLTGDSETVEIFHRDETTDLLVSDVVLIINGKLYHDPARTAQNRNRIKQKLKEML